MPQYLRYFSLNLPSRFLNVVSTLAHMKVLAWVDYASSHVSKYKDHKYDNVGMCLDTNPMGIIMFHKNYTILSALVILICVKCVCLSST